MSLVDHAILPSRSYPWKRGAGETLAPLLLPVAFPCSLLRHFFFSDSALLWLSRSCASRKFLQYSHFWSEQYGDPDSVCLCGTGWLAIF